MKLVQRVRQSNDSNLLSASKTLVFVSVFYGFLGQMRFALPNSLTCRAWVMRVFGWWYIYIYIHIVCFWMYPSPTDSEVVSWSFTIMPGFPEPCLWLWTNTTNPSGSFKLMNENNRTHKDATVSQREWKVYNFNPLHTGLQKQIHAKPRKYQRLLANGILRFRICAPKVGSAPKTIELLKANTMVYDFLPKSCWWIDFCKHTLVPFCRNCQEMFNDLAGIDCCPFPNSFLFIWE